MTDAPDQLDAADAALAAALDRDAPELLDLPTLAERTDLSLPLLEALAREGLLPARGPETYAEADLATVHSGLALLEAGLPLDELLRLARDADDALRDIAEDAVAMFLGFVRDPVRGTTSDETAAAERLVTAFETMLPEAERLVGRRFGQLVREAARARVADPDHAADSDTDTRTGTGTGTDHGNAAAAGS